MVAVPEDRSVQVEEELQVELLAYEEHQGRPSWLESRGLQRPLFWLLSALGATAVAFLGLGLLALAAPEAADRLAQPLLGVTAVLLSAVPAATLLSVWVVRLLGDPPGRGSPRSFWGSVTAIMAGVTATAAVALLRLALPRRFGLGLTLVNVASWILPVFAAWITERLAPAQPYRHALGVGLAFALGGALVMVPWGWVAISAPITVVLILPLLLVGAWVGVRFGPARKGPGVPA